MHIKKISLLILLSTPFAYASEPGAPSLEGQPQAAAAASSTSCAPGGRAFYGAAAASSSSGPFHLHKDPQTRHFHLYKEQQTQTDISGLDDEHLMAKFKHIVSSKGVNQSTVKSVGQTLVVWQEEAEKGSRKHLAALADFNKMLSEKRYKCLPEGAELLKKEDLVVEYIDGYYGLRPHVREAFQE